MKHPVVKVVHTCITCNKIFTRKDALKRHETNRCKGTKQEKKELKELENNIKLLKKSKIINKKLKSNIEIIKDNISIFNSNVGPINNHLINLIIDKNKKLEELTTIITVNKPEESSNNLEVIKNDTTDIISRKKDNYINASILCEKNNKNLNEWFSLESTNEIINEIVNNINVEQTQLIDNKNEKEIWIHIDLAIQLGQWISPKVALQITKWSRELYNSKLDINNKILKEKEQQIKFLQDLYVKKQPRKDYPENVIYMLTTEDNKKKRIYIIGKAKELKNRLSSYNKTSEHEVVYYKQCKNEFHMTTIELMVLTKLDEFREKANRDRFILPIDKEISLFTNIIDSCINFFN